MKIRSYNYGRPVEKLVVPTLAQTVNLFDKLRKSGKVFRVDFIKRTNGERRTMVCRFGVKKHLKGGKLRYDAGNKGLFTVWCFDKAAYRSVTIDNINFIKTGGTIYLLNSELPAGDYSSSTVEVFHRKGLRTVPASTSPLFTEQIV
jgi:hypothetical protein